MIIPDFITGSFITLHGLVHLWYVVLSQKLVPFKPEMGWNGHSWLFTNLTGDAMARTLAGISYSVSAFAIAASGISIMAHASFFRPVLIISAALSAFTLVVFWDGSFERIVEKGLIGLLINIAILVAAFIIK